MQLESRQEIVYLPTPQKQMGLIMICFMYGYIKNFITNQQLHGSIFPFDKACITFNLQEINVQSFNYRRGKQISVIQQQNIAD